MARSRSLKNLAVSGVSRTRRAAFAFAVVAFSLTMMVVMGLGGHVDTAAITALTGFKDIGLFVALTYIGGSTVDYTSTMLGKRLGVQNTDDSSGGGDDDSGDDDKTATGGGKITD